MKKPTFSPDTSVLKLLENWISSSNSDFSSKNTIITFLEHIGLDKIIWATITREEIFIEKTSESISKELKNKLTKAEFYQTVKDWIADKINKEVLEIDKDNFYGILHIKSNKIQGKISVIMADTLNISLNLEDVRNATKILMNYYELHNKINALENAIRIGQSSISLKNQNIINPNIQMSELSNKFVTDVVPHVFYSVMHEEYGPYIYAATNDEIKQGEHVLTVVKLFSGVDADTVSEVGHVYSMDPMKNPLGELISIIFSLPNENARGNYEVHALSILVPQEFLNLSKSLISEFKNQLFMNVEFVRMQYDKNSWNLAHQNLENQEILEKIHSRLKNLQENIALSYAMMLTPKDVKNW